MERRSAPRTLSEETPSISFPGHRGIPGRPGSVTRQQSPPVAQKGILSRLCLHNNAQRRPPRLEIVKGPWTPVAKQQALEREVLGHYIEYFNRAMKTRNWSPWLDFPLQEMRQFGERLSKETVNLLEGFLGVEEYVADYVMAGLELFRHNRTRRNMQLQWGAEESRHGVAWEIVLQHSGVRTEAEIQAYLTKVQAARWKLEQHSGLDTPLGSTVYAMVQERATYFNYQEMRARVREEYSLPVVPTQQEKKRGSEIGASEAVRVVGQDEISHHGLFLKIVQSHIKYFPSLTFETMNTVFRGFEMPALRFIPNAPQLSTRCLADQAVQW